ncbi:MAG: sigma-70 family RNA polymerase sigma factor [Pirellulaceae bacterium]
MNEREDDDINAFYCKAEKFFDQVRAARNGDQDALGSLMEEYRDYLAVIAKYEIDRDLQAKMGASDMIQQTMLEAYEHFDQFRGASPEEFKGWLRQILINEFSRARKHYFKAQSRQVAREHRLNDSQIFQPAIPDHLNTPGTDALIREQSRALELAMAQLPENYQQVIRLRDWEDQSFPQIGEQMKISEEAARKLWRRAIVKLESLLQPLIGTNASPAQTENGGSNDGRT